MIGLLWLIAGLVTGFIALGFHGAVQKIATDRGRKGASRIGPMSVGIACFLIMGFVAILCAMQAWDSWVGIANG